MAKMKIVWMSPHDLTPYENNARLHSAEQIDDLGTQIEQYGWDQPIVVDVDRVVIKGHGRREAAIRKGWAKVPVVVADHLTPDQVKAARLADNKIAERATWDTGLLKLELQDLKLAEFDLNLTGFSAPEIEAVVNAWAPDMGALGGVQETGKGARAVITVKCPPAREQEARDVIVDALRAAGLLMEVEIE